MKCNFSEKSDFENYMLNVINDILVPESKRTNNWVFCKYCKNEMKTSIERIFKKYNIHYSFVNLNNNKCKILYILDLYRINQSTVEDLLAPYLMDVSDIPAEEQESFYEHSFSNNDYDLFNIERFRITYFIIDKHNFEIVKIILFNKLHLEIECDTINHQSEKYLINDLCIFRIDDKYIEDNIVIDGVNYPNKQYLSHKILGIIIDANIPCCEIMDRDGKFSIRCELGVDDKYKHFYRVDLNATFRSSWEANVARILNIKKLHWKYEGIGFDRIDSNGNKKGSYTIPDFLIDNKVILEVKGFWDYDSLAKAREFITYYKEYIYYFIDSDIYYNLKQEYKSIIPQWEDDGCDKIVPVDVKVVGVSFGDRLKTISKLKEGDTVILERDPHNKFDKDAILITTNDGEEIGFLASEWAFIYSRKIYLGLKFEAFIKKIDKKIVIISIKQQEETTNIVYDFLKRGK